MYVYICSASLQLQRIKIYCIIEPNRLSESSFLPYSTIQVVAENWGMDVNKVLKHVSNSRPHLAHHFIFNWFVKGYSPKVWQENLNEEILNSCQCNCNFDFLLTSNAGITEKRAARTPLSN